MCGRFGATFTPRELANLMDADWLCPEPELPRYNVAPGTPAPVLLRKDGKLALDVFHWGLVPFWARDPRIGNRLINARGEGIAEKPAYRAAFQRRRCLVPAGGFYEWQKTPAGKVPQWIHAADGGPLTFAGLWESWRPAKDAPPVHTFTIVTTTPSADVSAIHDRMPVILDRDGRAGWTDPETPAAELLALLRPAPDGYLQSYAVSTAVNRPAFDGPDLIRPL